MNVDESHWLDGRAGPTIVAASCLLASASVLGEVQFSARLRFLRFVAVTARQSGLDARRRFLDDYVLDLVIRAVFRRDNALVRITRDDAHRRRVWRFFQNRNHLLDLLSTDTVEALGFRDHTLAQLKYRSSECRTNFHLVNGSAFCGDIAAVIALGRRQRTGFTRRVHDLAIFNRFLYDRRGIAIVILCRRQDRRGFLASVADIAGFQTAVLSRAAVHPTISPFFRLALRLRFRRVAAGFLFDLLHDDRRVVSRCFFGADVRDRYDFGHSTVAVSTTATRAARLRAADHRGGAAAAVVVVQLHRTVDTPGRAARTVRIRHLIEIHRLIHTISGTLDR